MIIIIYFAYLHSTFSEILADAVASATLSPLQPGQVYRLNVVAVKGTTESDAATGLFRTSKVIVRFTTSDFNTILEFLPKDKIICRSQKVLKFYINFFPLFCTVVSSVFHCSKVIC